MNIYTNIGRLLNSYGPVRSPTHAENREHFMRMLTCKDKTELNAYAITNIRMVASVVTRFLKRHPWAGYLVDDIFSTALCKLFESLQTLVDNANCDPEAFWTDIGHPDDQGRFPVSMYLYISMYRGVQRCFEEDAVQAISQEFIKKFTPIGADKPIRKHYMTKVIGEGLEYNHFDLVYLYDDILEHCKTDLERSIIEMRLTMDDPEISEVLGQSRQKIQWTRTNVYERFKSSLYEFSE